MNSRSIISVIVAGSLLASIALGSGSSNINSTVPNANARLGHPPNVIASGFVLQKIAEGSDPLENPSGVITNFGHLNDFPPQLIERTKTEPDENTYLVFD